MVEMHEDLAICNCGCTMIYVWEQDFWYCPECGKEFVE